MAYRKDPNELAALAARLVIDAKPHKHVLNRNAGMEWRYAAWDAEQLMKNARALKRLAELECNGIERWDAKAGQRLASWSEADQEKNDKRRTKLQKANYDIFRCYYAKTSSDVHGTDPRGAMIRFELRTTGKVMI
jgi:hypothetical protein